MRAIASSPSHYADQTPARHSWSANGGKSEKKRYLRRHGLHSHEQTSNDGTLVLGHHSINREQLGLGRLSELLRVRTRVAKALLGKYLELRLALLLIGEDLRLGLGLRLL